MYTWHPVHADIRVQYTRVGHAKRFFTSVITILQLEGAYTHFCNQNLFKNLYLRHQLWRHELKGSRGTAVLDLQN